MHSPLRGCDEPYGLPEPDVASAPPLAVTIRNPLRRELNVAYYRPDGEPVETLQFRARARSFRPLEGSVWIISDAQGSCVGRFTATEIGIVCTD